jgi:glycosyltransferase involved in cell wall biosynthesis
MSPLGVLGVVMPVYNEETTVAEVVARVLARTEVAQLVIVDDGSTDNSWALIERAALDDNRVVIRRHELNRGKGAAVRTGLSVVSTPYVVVQDADLEYTPEDYPALLSPLLNGRAAVVYGSRFLDPTLLRISWRHELGNRVLTWATTVITGLDLSDEATCFKAFRSDLIERLYLRENGFGFCPEFTAKVARLGVPVVEIPVRYSARSVAQGKKIRLHHGFEALWCLVRYSLGPRSSGNRVDSSHVESL